MASPGRNSWPVTVMPMLGPPAVGSRPMAALTGVGVGAGVGVGEGDGDGEGEGDGVGDAAGDAATVAVGVGVGVAATNTSHKGNVARALIILIRGTER
jgi:hypothetical protein